MDLEIVKTEWDGLTPALLSGNIDVIIAGMSPTEERKLTIDFTDAYYVTELCIVVRKNSAYAAAQSLADFQRNSMAAAPIRALAPATTTRSTRSPAWSRCPRRTPSRR